MDHPGVSHDPAQPFALPANQWRTHSIARRVMPLVAIFAVGLGLRLLSLGSKSLWLDEALSIRFASNSQQLWTGGYDHSHPPLYYALLHYWLQLGDSEFVLRLSSALLGSVAVPLGYMLAVRLGGRSLALSTAWLMALSPLLVWYAQELRSYSLLLVLGLLMALAFVRLVVRPHLVWWLLFIAAMSAALYTHYVALALPPVQLGLMAVLYLQKRITRRGIFAWLAAWPVVFLLYWPWLTSPGMSEFIRLMGSSDLYPIELLASRLSISPTFATALIALAALLAVLMALVTALFMLRHGRATWSWWATFPITRYGLLLLFLAITLALVVPRAYTVKKLLVHLWPFGLLVVGWVFPWRVSNRLPLALLLAASLVGSLANVLLVPKDQWREMAIYLVAHGEPTGESTDAIWVAPNYHTAPLNYYLARASNPTFDVQRVSPTMSEQELEALLEQGQRVWLIYHTVNVRIVDPERRLEQWLTAHLQAVDQIDLYKIEATLYAPEP